MRNINKRRDIWDKNRKLNNSKVIRRHLTRIGQRDLIGESKDLNIIIKNHNRQLKKTIYPIKLIYYCNRKRIKKSDYYIVYI